MKTISVSTFLSRLIWLCVLPPAILAIYFAVHEVRTLRDRESQEAENQVRNIATYIDNRLQALILPLKVMAASSSVDDPPRFREFYNECKAFGAILGVHVILADTSKQMIFNTREQYGASLPKLPASKGNAAAPAVLETGKPAVGDLVFGPVAKEPLVAVAVPVVRNDRTRFLLLCTIETRQFQQRLDQISIPDGWELTVFDGAGEVIARRAPNGSQRESGEEVPGKTFTAKSAVSRWSAVLKVPQSLYRSKILEASAVLAAAILAVTLISVVSGRVAVRKLTRSVERLAETPRPGESQSAIAEIEAVRQRLRASAEARDEAEARLQESEQRYRDLYENAPDMYASVDTTQGQIIQCNQTLLRVTDYSRDEVIGSPVFKLYDPDSIEGAKNVLRSFQSTGKIDNAELQLRCKDGRKVYVILNATAVYDDSGNIAYSRSSLRDITDRKRAEEALRESEEKYRLLAENTSDVIWQMDPDLRFTYVNQAILHMTGYAPDEWVGTALSDHCDEENFAKMAEAASGGRADGIEGAGSIVEAVMLKKNQQPFPVEIHVKLLFDEHGTPVSIQGVTRDITERKKAEEALRASEERYRTVADFNYDWEYWVDTEAKFVYVSPSCKRITGYSEEEFMDDPGLLEKITHPDDLAGLLNHINVSRNEAYEQPHVHDFRIVHRDGGTRWIAHACQPVYNRDGLPLGRRASIRDITERKKVEKALVESEVLYRNLFEGARDAIMLIDMEGDDVGRIVSANPVAAAIHGYSLDEFLAHRLIDLETPDSVAGLPARINAVLSRQLIRGEVTHRRIDGSIFPLEISASLVEISGHKYCIAIDRDISVRKLALERQRRLNLLQQALLGPEDLMTKLKMITDGVVDIWGADFCRVWHIVSGDLCEEGCIHAAATEQAHVCLDRRRCLRLLSSSGRYAHTDGAAHQRIPFGAYKIGHVASGAEHRFLTNDVTNDLGIHDREWARELDLVAFAGYQLRPPGGETIGVLALFSKHVISPEEDAQLDGFSNAVARVIRSAQYEDRLKESEAKFREFFVMANDCVFILSPNGQWLDFNEVAMKMLGCETREELLQTRMTQFFENPADAERFGRLIMENEYVRDFSIQMKRKDGTIIDTLISARSKKLRDGTITAMSGTIRDVTERKRLQDQLSQAQKMEAIGTLAGGIAHDFNNVLQVALGYSEIMLEEREFPERYRADLRKIRESSKRGADLVQRLLTFSRKTETNLQSLDLNDRISDLRKILERTLPKMVDIQLVQDVKLFRINADKTQMDQVLMNLAVNARDAMPDGGRLVFETANAVLDDEYVRAHLEAKPGPHALLTVTDTGFGMDNETLRHIFEPFYTTKGIGEGTGLGLAMVHGIVKHHGGHIRCYSEPGHGTTFKIYFPAMIAEKDEGQTQESPMAPGGSETILLVDDEEFIRDLGSRILEKAGYKVITAANGKEALETYERRRDEIALVFLDLMMPEMGGKECLERLLGINPSVKVVIASGYLASGPTKEVLDAGAEGFVNKPYDMRQVRKVAREVLDERGGSSQPQ